MGVLRACELASATSAGIGSTSRLSYANRALEIRLPDDSLRWSCPTALPRSVLCLGRTSALQLRFQ